MIRPLLLLVLLCLVVACYGSSNITCRTIDHSIMPYCAQFLSLTRLISANFNETIADNEAYNAVHNNPSECPYYTSGTYQCEVYFPRCIDDPATPNLVCSADQTEGCIISKVCRKMCYDASTAYGGLCSKLGYGHFQVICENMDLYNDPPNCFKFKYAPKDKSDDIVMYIVVSILVIVCIGLMGSMIRNQKRKKAFNYDKDEKWQFEKDEEKKDRAIALKIAKESNKFEALPNEEESYDNIRNAVVHPENEVRIHI